MIEGSDIIKTWLDALAIVLSINIILWFLIAIYYNIKRVMFYKKTTGKVFFITYFNSIVSALFVIAFLYIIISTFVRGSIIDNSSYGAIVIRPLIVLEAVGTAIHEKEKYVRKGAKCL